MMGANLDLAILNYTCLSFSFSLSLSYNYIYTYTMGPGPGLVAHVLWRYCMRLASSGVGGVRRVRLAFGRHPMPNAPPPHTSTNIQ